MPRLGSLFTQFHLSSKAPEGGPSQSPHATPTLPDFVQHVRKLTGIRKEDVYSNLRIRDQFQAAKNEIDMVILTGQGIFCVDVKPWRGTVSARTHNWHVQTKTANLRGHLKRSGVSVRQSLFFPRVIFLSPDCQLDEELRKRRELISHGQTDDFLRSFREGYMAWISDALTPSWLSGRLSYSQMESVRGVLRRVGTWDRVSLHCGEQLKGDFQGCQYIALDRQETETLEFSRVGALSADSLWALLGHTPQVTVKMYKRGSQSWLGKSLNASITIPSNTAVIFRISGEEEDAKIPANTIHSIFLSN
uniref:uncharacterized protein si:zfos-911d5.4 isoform X2 n=1 Tax=Gasterosteus aculeatus aculeatus TaxID=481459 RepID=UPI001A9A1CFF|nr:uncharacterized protein si:zfos-911d5.4 isoform X2 [Gasterosteus aculeatus aculeatus]